MFCKKIFKQPKARLADTEINPFPNGAFWSHLLWWHIPLLRWLPCQHGGWTGSGKIRGSCSCASGSLSGVSILVASMGFAGTICNRGIVSQNLSTTWSIQQSSSFLFYWWLCYNQTFPTMSNISISGLAIAFGALFSCRKFAPHSQCLWSA